MLTRTKKMLRSRNMLVLCLLISACSQQPTRDSAIRSYVDTKPADLSGSWGRNYWRGDDVNKALERWFRQLRRATPDQRLASYPGVDNAGAITSSRDVTSILALARLADVITRLRSFTIFQSEHEISVEREQDFDMFCEFYDGVSQGTSTDFGTEICGWDGHQFVSRLILPDGLLVSHRFTIAADGENLHVATTVSSSATGLSFTLNRYYTKFEPYASPFDCIETLSRNRVCTMGEDSP